MIKGYVIDEGETIIKQLIAAGVKVTATDGEIHRIEFDSDIISIDAVQAIIGKAIKELK